MDFASLFGLIFGIGSIAVGYAIDGGSLSSLWMFSAMLITLGGSIGAICVSYGLPQLIKMPGLILSILIKPKSTIRQTANLLHFYSQNARQSGLLSLERLVTEQQNDNPFLKRSILMVVDGTDAEKISSILENDIDIEEQNRMTEIQMFDTMAAYCPAFGMVGTIVGLIRVLAAGMDDPNALTKAIGIAFITTLYGVLLANLLLIPVSTKLKARLKASRLEKEMIIEAVCAIRNGINPRLLREQLSSYVATSSSRRRSGRKSGYYYSDTPVEQQAE